jgi:hypothetical protein
MIFLGTEDLDSKPIMRENNQGNSLYGYFKELTSVLEELVLVLGSTKYFLTRYSPPMCYLRNSLASSSLNHIMGIGSCNILANTEGAREIGCCPWSWIILFS